MPATGFGGDSKKLLMDVVKEVRAETGVTYAKIDQCYEDCPHRRKTDLSAYPPHIYDQDTFRVLVHGVLGRPDGRFFESTAAKANDQLQDVRINQQLEPIAMANHGCSGTLARPIAIYMFPVSEEYNDRGAQLAEDIGSFSRAQLDSKRKDPSDMQQEGEDDETHKKRLKFLASQRRSEAKLERHESDIPVANAWSKPDDADVAKPPQVRKLPMALFDARKNKLLGGWSATPPPSEHRAIVESKYLIDAMHQQLGCDEAALRLNEVTSPYSFHSWLSKLSKTDSGLSGSPAYTGNQKRTAALHQAVKDRWLGTPHPSSSGSGSASA